MPIKPDSSLVIDSLVSTPEVPKPRRTYGRSKPKLQSEEHFSATYHTAPKSNEECPSTDPIDEDANGGPSFQFEWQKRLAAMDEDPDSDNALISPSKPPKSRTMSLEPLRAESASPPPRTSRQLPPSSPPSPLHQHSHPPDAWDRDNGDSDIEKGRLFASTSSSVRPETAADQDTPPTSPPVVLKRVRKAARRISRALSSSPGDSVPSKPRGDAGKSHTKTKAPTKKEIEETERERVRLANEQQITIPRSTKQIHTLTKFFQKLQPELSSDPITSFSSPDANHATHRPTSSVDLPSQNPFEQSCQISSSLEPNDLEGDSDEDLPDIGQLNAELSAADRLKRRKLEILEEQKRMQLQLKLGALDDDDDELFVIEPQEEPPAVPKRSWAKGKTKAELDRELLLKQKQRDQEEIRRKEEEWQRRGGTIKDTRTDVLDVQEYARKIAEAAIQNHHRTEVAEEELDDDDDEEDGDYEGSQNPIDDEDERAILRDLEMDAPGDDDDDFDTTMVEDENGGDEEENNENAAPRANRRRRAILDDESDAENFEDMPLTGRSASELFSESECNKENDFDALEDKENSAIPARPLFGHPGQSLHGLEREFESRLRPPLAVLGTDGMESPQSKSVSFSELLRLNRNGDSDAEMDFEPAPLEFAPLNFNAGGGDKSMSLSQSSQETLFATPVLQPGFGDLFSDSTQKDSNATQGKGLRKGDTFTRLFGDVRKTSVDLGLTQDISMAPAFEADASLKRKADQIFQKEQEAILEAASEKELQMYVNENGFLTQTRPDHSPEIYRRPSPTQHPSTPSQSPLYTSFTTQQTLTLQSQRQPLRTISYASPSQFQPRRRLRKRRSPSSNDGEEGRSPSPSPSKRPIDIEEPRKKKARFLDRRLFEEGEAEEEDDEDANGFGVTSREPEGDADEEDGEHLDQDLAILVDNKHMDNETIAVDKVQEKFKEHVKQDDEKLQKLVQDVVDGKRKSSKRKGVEFGGDSDDESDYEDIEDIRRRQKMGTKVRMDIESMKENPDTAAFANAYNVPEDEDMMFSLPDPGHKRNIEDGEDADMDEDGPREVVRADDLHRELREAALRDEEDQPVFDPGDVSRIEDQLDSEDEESPRVKTVDSMQAVAGPSRPRNRQDGLDDLDVGLVHTSQELPTSDRIKKWAQTERRPGKVNATGRQMGGLAIRGGHKSVASGEGSLRKVASAQATKQGQSGKRNPPVKTAASFLAKVDREGRFGA